MNIYRFLTVYAWKHFEARSIEPVLRSAMTVIDDRTRAEMGRFILSCQCADGGFQDRGGRSDVYYTLFGHFVAQALGLNEIILRLKEYVRQKACDPHLSGTDLYCSAILYASLFGRDAISRKLAGKIRSVIGQSDISQPEYTYFMVVISLIYLEDFRGAREALKAIRNHNTGHDMPCPVVAAFQVLSYLENGDQTGLNQKIMGFYRGNGGFSALADAPGEDLLSTAVALFALQFMKTGLGRIKADCLQYIDSLYEGGGFRASSNEEMIDTEYTFYGLLALGSLSS